MEKKEVSEHQDTPITNFETWLQREFLKRRKKNARYSLRSFASYLQLAPPTVSHLLAGRRKPSVRFATKVLSQLEASPQEYEIVLNSLRKENSFQNEVSEKQNYQMIALDAFKLIADWEHYAILELAVVQDFKPELNWIANQLGISVTEARQAVDRLLRLDLLEKKNDNLLKTNAFVTNYEEGMTSSALKQLQRHVLQKALDAIDETPADEKDITSMTMAIDTNKIPEAKKRIKKFRRQLCDFLGEGRTTRVYNLGIQLYPISKKQKK